jgi:hypothetical protein
MEIESLPHSRGVVFIFGCPSKDAFLVCFLSCLHWSVCGCHLSPRLNCTIMLVSLVQVCDGYLIVFLFCSSSVCHWSSSCLHVFSVFQSRLLALSLC